MPLHLLATFEWSNDDVIFVTSLAEELRVFGHLDHQSRPQQDDTTTHEMKLRASPATAGRVLDLFAGVAEAGALVTLEMHTEEK